MARNVIRDATGVHDLEAVVSIASYQPRRGNPPQPIGKPVALLRFSSGAVVTTASDFDATVAQWLGGAAPAVGSGG